MLPNVLLHMKSSDHLEFVHLSYTKRAIVLNHQSSNARKPRYYSHGPGCWQHTDENGLSHYTSKNVPTGAPSGAWEQASLVNVRRFLLVNAAVDFDVGWEQKASTGRSQTF